MPRIHRTMMVGLLALSLLAGCVIASEPGGEAQTLRDAAGRRVLIGTAIQAGQLDDPALSKLIGAQFNSLTAENEMKPDALQRERGVFTFERADRIVAFAEANGQAVIGHVLVWHHQSPGWMFEDESGEPLPRERALENMREHIFAVVGRYKGRIRGWDVVNEAVDDSGPYLRDTPARRAIGDDYIVKAFEFAHEADPDAELYYNDYNIERDYKRDKAVRLVRELKAAGVRLDGVGIQGHWLLESPELDEIERGVLAFLDEGVSVMLTEVEVDPLPRRRAGADLSEVEQAGLDPYKDGLPEEMQQRLAERYGELFGTLLRYPGVTRITLWGVHDGQSWLNYWPVRGRTNHPLLFDRDYQTKPAFDAVLRTLKDADTAGEAD